MKGEDAIKFSLKGKEAEYERMIRESQSPFGNTTTERGLLSAEIRTLKWVLF